MKSVRMGRENPKLKKKRTHIYLKMNATFTLEGEKNRRTDRLIQGAYEHNTAGLLIMSFHSMSFHCNADEEKNPIPDWGHCLCGVCTFFPRLHGFTPTAQNCAQQANWHVYTVPV